MARRFPTSATSRSSEVSAGQPDFDWSWAEDGSLWVAPTIDTKHPSIARCYDYALGGKDNYEIDRNLAHRLFDTAPDAAKLALANRDFVTRAVRVMAEAGITQFLDLGCGIPTAPTVHEIARDVAPDARVAYIDHDPIVLAHVRAVLDGQQGLFAALHDLREPSRILSDPGVRAIIRMEEPLGLIMGSVLHFVDLSIGVQVVQHYLDKISSGSLVAFSVATSGGVPTAVIRTIETLLRKASAPVVFRTTAQVEELLDGLEQLPPGITDVTRWRAQNTPGTLRLHAGVAAKR